MPHKGPVQMTESGRSAKVNSPKEKTERSKGRKLGVYPCHQRRRVNRCW